MAGMGDILGAGLPVAGGIIGNIASSGDRQKYIDENKEAVQQWLDLNVPDPQQQKIELQKYVSTGNFSPQLQQNINQGPSAMQGVQANGRDQDAQMKALDSLSQIGESGGMTIGDKANLENSINTANASQAGRVGAIQQGMAARGLGGSGLDLQAQLASNQQANQAANQAATNTAVTARQRALDAILGGGNLAGNMRSQDFGEKAQRANASDAISRFNAANANQIAGANVNRQNQGQLYNLENNQNISNMNTGVANQQEMHNKGLLQQQYQNQLKKVGGAAGQLNNMGDVYNKSADHTAQQWANIGAGAGQLGSVAFGGKPPKGAGGGGGSSGGGYGGFGGGGEEEDLMGMYSGAGGGGAGNAAFMY